MQTKVIDNKLKIIDDVPSSAVEMAVKEKVVGFEYFAFHSSSWLCLLTCLTLSSLHNTNSLLLVPEESSATGAHCGGSEACAETCLQH